MQANESNSYGGKRNDSKRGRTSHAAYIRVVGRALTQGWYALETCETFSQLELVSRLVAARPLSNTWLGGTGHFEQSNRGHY